MTATPRVPIVVPREGAKVLIVKFNDFQCPPCRNSHMAYKPILAKFAMEHPGEVRYVLKDYPLDSECNANVANTIHPSACEAAVAVRLARTHNREEAMIEWIFANQPMLTPELVKQGGARRGTGDGLRREVRGDARARQGRHRARQTTRRQRHADLFHQRRQGRRRAAAAVLPAGDRVRADPRPK